MCMAEKECFGAAPGEKSPASREGLFAVRAGIISSYMDRYSSLWERRFAGMSAGETRRDPGRSVNKRVQEVF